MCRSIVPVYAWDLVEANRARARPRARIKA